jgi:hypothetical protein
MNESQRVSRETQMPRTTKDRRLDSQKRVKHDETSICKTS